MNPLLDRVYFARTQFGRALRLVATLQDRFLLRVQFRHRVALLFGVGSPLRFDLFNSLFDLRDPKRDFLLFLLELF